MTAPVTIVLFIYPNVTLMDFAGPLQVFHRIPGVQTVIASPKGGTVPTDCGISISPTVSLSDVLACDVLCVPGGAGSEAVLMDSAILKEVARVAKASRYLTSVCTSSLILGAAGLLGGKRAACHWAWREILGLYGAIPDSSRVVREGNLITGGGVTAGIDFALVVASEVAGENAAKAIQLSIEYAPEPPFESGRPETAPPQVREKVEKLAGARRARVEAWAKEHYSSTKPTEFIEGARAEPWTIDSP